MDTFWPEARGRCCKPGLLAAANLRDVRNDLGNRLRRPSRLDPVDPVHVVLRLDKRKRSGPTPVTIDDRLRTAVADIDPVGVIEDPKPAVREPIERLRYAPPPT